MKYAWIREHRDSFPVAVLCDALEVSASGYYAWLDRPPSPRAQRHAQIQAAVQQVHTESHGIYGSHKIARKLEERPDLESACRNTVAKAMRELGLQSRISRAFTPTTTQADPTKQPAPNQLAQDFAATAPNRKWVTDITYLPTAEGWVYLAVVLDQADDAYAENLASLLGNILHLHQLHNPRSRVPILNIKIPCCVPGEAVRAGRSCLGSTCRFG